MKGLKQNAALLLTMAAGLLLMFLAVKIVTPAPVADTAVQEDAVETFVEAAPHTEEQAQDDGEPSEPQKPAVLALNGTELMLINKRSGDDTPLADDDFIYPLKTKGEITSRFGSRSDPSGETDEQSFHSGTDIDAKEGDPILAALSGVVELSEEQTSGYGKVVALYHGGGTFTLYAHCSKLLVEVGDEVESGEVIALVGETGYALGDHLHYEVLSGGTAVDPEDYL